MNQGASWINLSGLGAESVHPVVGFRPCKAYAVRFQLDSSKWLIETEGMMGAGTGEEAREVFDPPMSYPVVPTRLAQSRRLRSYVHHRAHYSENYAGIATWAVSHSSKSCILHSSRGD